MRLVVYFAGCVVLSGCASEERVKNFGVLTVAVAGEKVFVGRSRPAGLQGSFRISSLEDEPIVCTGRYQYSNVPYGRARFTCTNGEEGKVRIESHGHLIGAGKGSSSLGPVQIVFGYSLRQAISRLELPDGKELILRDSKIVLIDKYVEQDQ